MSDHARPAPATAEEAALLGAPDDRPEGHDKVTGAADYLADLPLPPGTLHAAFVTSPVPHGRIVSVDTSAALALPGVHAVLTGEDVRGLRQGRRLQDRPILCWDRVLFIGDRIAAVAAETPEIAEQAAQLVDVELEELPAVFSYDEAVLTDAPVLHREAETYTYLDGTRKPVPHPNLQGRMGFAQGDPDIEAVFARAAHVVEGTFTTPRQHGAALEPHGTLVWIDEAGVAQVLTTNKNPFGLRKQLVGTFGEAADRFAVDASLIGGDFGSKGYSQDEGVCIVLARKTGRPVRALSTFAEMLGGVNTRHPATIRMRTACDDEGRLIAHESEILLNGGAYAAAKPLPTLVVSGATSSLAGYVIPNVKIEIRNAYTNTLVSGHVRSPGEVQALFAGESQLDELARLRGEDPLEFRLRNAVQHPGERGANGEVHAEPLGRRILELAGEAIEWSKPRPPGRGVGIAMSARHIGGGKIGLKLRLHADGRIQLITGLSEQGAGQWGTIRRSFAVAASIPESRIELVSVSTAEALFDPGVGGSRVTHIGSNAAHLLAEKLHAWLDERVPGVVPDAAGDVVLRDGELVDAATGRALATLDDVLSRAVPPDEPALLSAVFEAAVHGADDPSDHDFGAVAVEVEVDPETGAYRILQAVASADVGAIVHPVAHRGQLEGGFTFGLGGAVMEELIDEGGIVTNPSLADFKIPSAGDVPPLKVVVLTGGDGPGAYGAKMAGELTNAPVAPAVANAIADAIGVRIRDLPITAERVYAAILEVGPDGSG
jgi:CO/xanthine dehydrogenase Mo-binding subunit